MVDDQIQIIDLKGLDLDKIILGMYPFQNVSQALLIGKLGSESRAPYIVICKMPPMDCETRTFFLQAIKVRLQRAKENNKAILDTFMMDEFLWNRKFTREGFDLLFGGKLPYTNDRLIKTVKCPYSEDDAFKRYITFSSKISVGDDLFRTAFEHLRAPCLQKEEVISSEYGQPIFSTWESVEAYIKNNWEMVTKSFQIKNVKLYTPHDLTEYIYQSFETSYSLKLRKIK